MTATPTAPAGALAGIRVLDLTTARSGPTCVRQLADLGADVVQVHDPRRPQLAGSDGHNLHRTKRSAVIDVRHPDGLAAVLRLVDRADVLVENGRPGALDRLGLGPEAMLARQPRLVYASISGFGATGPIAGRPGVDQIAQGMSGLMSVTGPPGTGPWRVGVAVSDTLAGTFLTQGVLAALFARERTGRGQWVHTSLLEAAVNLLDFQACRWLTDGVVPGQEGNDHPTIFPMGCYATADGHVNVAAAKDVPAFLEVLDLAWMLDDDRFATPAARAAHRGEFNAIVEARLGERSTAHWVTALSARGLPAGPVYRIDEVFADDQVRHLDLVRTVHHERDGDVAVLRHPVTFHGTPTVEPTAPPVPGADTRDVLREAGYADAEIDALVAAGAAAERLDPTPWW